MNQYTGDGIMALFGAPIAHEDHAQRACYAALHLRHDLRMDYTAQGHVVGLAARMEQLAESGRAYLTEHTAKLAGGYLTLRDLGPSAIKGASEP